MNAILADFAIDEIAEPGSTERLAVVTDVLEDGVLRVCYEDGETFRAVLNGVMPYPSHLSYLQYLVDAITDTYGAAYVIVQHTASGACRLWYPDEDGELQLLRLHLAAAGVVSPEEL